MLRFKFWKSTLGMSLIEVTVALVVMGIVGISLLNLFVNGSTSAAIARRDVTAVNLAQGKLEEIKSKPYAEVQEISAPNPESRPRFDTASEYTYQVSVVENDNRTLKTVTVAVYYKVGSKERVVTLTTDKLKR